ncbi:hypothetical protein RBSH_05194 [Rhodopirellula baltica SH28]|uniref:Uncharacterized protein n=1 Tax=Rhodopirellula baltica SH28 TaxID=993517 RepID=K5C8R7_RHOBT|nr:hypothetical protein RBSH_05194 [Rhodopirellula baltica SH28]
MLDSAGCGFGCHVLQSLTKRGTIETIDRLVDSINDYFFYILHRDTAMVSPIVKVDDKHLPLYRVVWIADLPHFCGEEDCQREGYYEIRLDVEDSVWTSSAERDEVLEALNRWCGDPRDDPDERPF